MERLSDRAIEIINELHTERLDYNSEYLPLIDAANKLGLYEDLGLEPREVSVLCDMDRRAKMAEMLRTEEKYSLSIDRIKELVEADREGRCVVLPCKVGDSMWVHDKDGKPREMKLGSPDIRCYCKEEDNFCMTLCAEKRTGVCAYRLRNDGKDIGKTVFRTREAAESALKVIVKVNAKSIEVAEGEGNDGR